MNRRRVMVLKGGGVVFSPYIDASAAWDFSDPATLFKDTSRTIPVTSDGDAIAGVSDKSGHGKHLSQSVLNKRMLYKTGIKNGLSVARADGSNDSFSCSNLSLVQPLTVIVVGKGSLGNFYDTTTLASHILCRVFAGKYSIYAKGSFVQNGNADMNYHIFMNGYEDGNSYIINDGVKVVGNAGADGTFVNDLIIGISGFDLASDPLNGDICEILIYSGLISPAYLKQLESFFNAKWGLAVNGSYDSTVMDEAGISNALVRKATINDGALYFDGQIGDFSQENLLTNLSMKTKFNGNNMSVIVRAKGQTGLWANASQRDIFRFDGSQATVSQQIVALDKPAGTTNLRAFYWCAEGQGFRTITVNMAAVLDWFTFGIKIDNSGNIFKAFLNGSDLGAYAGTNPLAPFTGALQQANIGSAQNSTDVAVAYNWWGWVGDVVLSYGITASDVQMQTLNTKLTAGNLAKSDLDTIFGAGNWSWWRNNVIL